MYSYLVACILCIGLSIAGIGQDIAFTQITTTYTNCIMRDHEGFIWIGTQDGLMRHDANEFRTFRNIPGDSLSLPNNFVWCLGQDKHENIWIGTFGGGLVMWNKFSETFTTYFCEPPGPGTVEANTIRTLLLLDSLIFLGTESGIRVFDTRSHTFYSGAFWDTLSALHWFTYAIDAGEQGELFVGTENGLFLISRLAEDPEIVQLSLPENATQTVPDVLYHEGTLYVGSENGLLISDDRTHFENHFDNYGQPRCRVQQIYIDPHGDIWLATQNGLARFSDNRYDWFYANPQMPQSLKTDIIHCISMAEEDILVAGTRQGVHQFSINPPMFQSLNALYENRGCSSTALGMAEDHDGDIWICSRGGLMYLEVDGNIPEWEAKCFLPENTPGMTNAYTINITCDRNGAMWVAYRYNGFSKIQPVGNNWEWKQFPRTVALFNGEGVNQIYQDRKGDYWIATRGFGLMKFFPERDEVKTYGVSEGLSHPYIFRIYEDSKDQMWLATAGGGLCKFDRNNERFTCFVNDRSNPGSLSSNMVLAMTEDNRQRLWVCTVDGLNVMEEPGTFSIFTTMDGLPNNVIYAALHDADSMMWLSTNEGIVKMHYDEDMHVLDIFDTRDGIPGPEFNQHAFLKHSSGIFLFGGIDGITVWNPEAISTTEYHPQIALTDFLLYNTSVPVGRTRRTKSFVLDTNINNTRKIVLKYNQNFIAFKYSALGYAHAKVGTYEYKMAGIDDDWIRAGDRRFASYPGLDPGAYTYMVRVSNREGIPDPRIKSIQVKILPPPWRTWWAYSIYVILFLAGIFGLLWLQAERSRSIERARAAERDVFRKKMARDFHDEAGNKITLLSLLTDRARKKSEGNAEVIHLLAEQQGYIQELRNGMRDFIWILDPSKDSLFDTVVRFRDFAEKACEQADVSFSEIGRTETLREVVMPGNVRRHFLLIFKEALNNSLKYANAGRIGFSIRKNPAQQWEFELRDDGKGFDLQSVTKGNGLDNMKSRAAQIHSELHIRTGKESGTSVIMVWSPRD